MRSRLTDSFSNGFKRETELRKLETILSSDKSDYEKAVEMRRIFQSANAFKTAYFYLIEQDNYYRTKKESIYNIYTTINRYEEAGLYDKAKEEEKFKLRQADYKDTRDIIKAYIADSESYRLNDFLDRQCITLDNFKSAKTYIKKYMPELYDEFLKVSELNKTKEILMPIFYLSEIKQGIETGTTSNGESFDIYEFWKLNPFKVDDMDREMRNFFKKHEKFREMSYINRDKNNGKHISLNYADYFDAFVTVIGIDKEHVIRDYMADNKIKSCTLTNKDRIRNNYQTSYPELNDEDIESIINYMEVEKIPFVHEAFTKLVEDYEYMKEVKTVNKKLVKELKRSSILDYKGE